MLIVVAVVADCSLKSFAQSANAPARLTYDSFRTVSDRNIFNPNRFARGSGRTTTKTGATPASRVESFSLVGIMAYEKGWFAFFDGTKSEYKQALQANGAIGEYNVIHVSASEVKVAKGTNTFDLKVGMQMRREDEGEWFLSDGGEAARKRIVSTRTRTRGGSREEGSTSGGTEGTATGGEPEVIVLESETPSEVSTSENSANGNGTAATAEGDGGITDPVLRAMMERRQRALNP